MRKDMLAAILLILVFIYVIAGAMNVIQSQHVEIPNKPPELIASYKVGDEPHYHRVWRVVVDGEVIEYVEIVEGVR